MPVISAGATFVGVHSFNSRSEEIMRAMERAALEAIAEGVKDPHEIYRRKVAARDKYC